MNRFQIAAVAVLVLIFSFPLSSAEPDWYTVLARIDELGDFENNDFSAEITIVSKKPGEDDSTIVVRYFRRDSKKEFTMVLLEPAIQKGQGYFSSNNDLWFYDPESRKFAYSSLKDSFQGSDAQNSDFSSSSLASDYTVESAIAEKLGAADTWALTLVAKDRTVAVAKRKLWVRVDNYLVLKEEHYSVSNRLMRTLAYPKYQTVEGKFVPQAILIVDNLKVGERTQLTFKAPSVSRLPDSVFNKEYLQKVNQ
ncbi:MAG TPA: outer membrane lipoprotein-sorting protein [Treponemataceae bacterium]|nr:outer membrane lipoprotein-sorting protein [Treponemataceae bacterium]